MKKFCEGEITPYFRTKGDNRYATSATLAPREFHTTFLKAINERYTPYNPNPRGGNRNRGNRGGNRGNSNRGNGRGRAQFNGRGSGQRGYHNPQPWPKSESFNKPKPLDFVDKADAKRVISLLQN